MKMLRALFAFVSTLIISMLHFGASAQTNSNGPVASPESTAPIRVLIVDGFSNHDWKRTTAYLKAILEATHLFTVDVSTCPAHTDDPAYATWCPHFTDYAVVIQNCNNLNSASDWPYPAKAAFVDFVRNGGGVYMHHSANNAFANWPEYNQMIGLGWRKKDFGWALQVGPDEALIKIAAGLGEGTSHQAKQDHLIHRMGTDQEDPIHAGMPRAWMTPMVEVYTFTRGPAENLQVLSWGEDPKTHVHWPMEWTVTFGKGRVFCSSFGHVWKDEHDPVDMRCAGFQTVLVRAIQWLAQRPVTFPIPADFPGPGVVSLRPIPEIPKELQVTPAPTSVPLPTASTTPVSH